MLQDTVQKSTLSSIQTLFSIFRQLEVTRQSYCNIMQLCSLRPVHRLLCSPSTSSQVGQPTQPQPGQPNIDQTQSTLNASVDQKVAKDAKYARLNFGGTALKQMTEKILHLD